MRRLAERTRERRRQIVARAPPSPEPGRSTAISAVLQRDGDFWTVGVGGSVFRLKDSKGIRCLAHLLRHPNQAFHSMELDALATMGGTLVSLPPGLKDAGVESPIGHAGAVLDARARLEYRDRLRELRAALEEATTRNDFAAATRLRGEIETIGEELERALGLGARPRVMGSPHERARINVTKQLRASIRRIGMESPPLGDALERSVRTGRLCSYEPDPRAPIDWEL